MIAVAVALILASIEVLYFGLFIDVGRKTQDGLVFVKVWIDGRKTSGWIKRSTFYNCVNGNKANYETITLTKKGATETIVYGSIKQFKEVRRVIEIILGSL